MYSMTEAWTHRVVKRQMINGKSYKMIYPFLRCRCFANFGSQSIAVGEPQYYNDLRFISSTWFEQDFIRSHTILAAHKAHDPTIQVIHVYYNTEVITPKLVVQLPTELKNVLEIISASSHFAFFTKNLEENEILIFDGLGYKLNCWIPHAINLFKKCGLIDLDALVHFRCPKQGVDVIDKILRAKVKDGSTWSLKAGPSFFKQTDGHNCGPLASLKMMEVFGRFDR
jgi:hypothetical protein